jgi:DNA polymerase-3 subunit alpha
VDLRLNNKSVVESLVAAGAMDCFGQSRNHLMSLVDQAVRVGSSTQADRKAGQMSLLGGDDLDDEPAEDAATLPEWPESMLLKKEKDVLGFYLTSHPLTREADRLRRFSSTTTVGAESLPDGREVVIGGLLKGIRFTVAKSGRSKGETMALFRLEDLEGEIGCVLFSTEYARFESLLSEDRVAFLRGVVSHRREEPGIKVNEIIPLDKVDEHLAHVLRIRLETAGIEPEQIDKIRRVVSAHPGECGLLFDVTLRQGGRALIRAGDAFGVKPVGAVVEDVSRVLPGCTVHFE